MGETDRSGKLGLVPMGGAMLSKSLIQFSVDEWRCILPLLFTWGQKLKIMASGPITSWKIDGETVGSYKLYLLGLQNHYRW